MEKTRAARAYFFPYQKQFMPEDYTAHGVSGEPEDIFLAGWITGFTDGEGCFSVSFNKKERLRTKIEVRPSFSLAQKGSPPVSLTVIEKYFGEGGLRFSSGDGMWIYETRSIKVLTSTIIPFFKKHRLKTKKENDFNIFCEICSMIQQSQHLNPIGLREIILKAYTMNSSGKRKYTQEKLLDMLRET